MKNKRYTITATDINTGSIQTLTIPMTVVRTSSNGEVQTIVLKPLDVQSYNYSGADLEFNFFANDDEWNEYQADATNFDFITFGNETMLTADARNFLSCYKFCIKKKSGTATADLEIEFINYR